MKSRTRFYKQVPREPPEVSSKSPANLDAGYTKCNYDPVAEAAAAETPEERTRRRKKIVLNPPVGSIFRHKFSFVAKDPPENPR